MNNIMEKNEIYNYVNRYYQYSEHNIISEKYNDLKESIYYYCLDRLSGCNSYIDMVKVGFITYLMILKLKNAYSYSNDKIDLNVIDEVYNKLKYNIEYDYKNKFDRSFKDDVLYVMNNNLYSDKLYSFDLDTKLNNIPLCKFKVLDYDSIENLESYCYNDLYNSIYYINFNNIKGNFSYEEYLNLAIKVYKEQVKLNLKLGMSDNISDTYLAGCIVNEMGRYLYDSTDIGMRESWLMYELKDIVIDNTNGILNELKVLQNDLIEKKKKNNKSLIKRLLNW